MNETANHTPEPFSPEEHPEQFPAVFAAFEYVIPSYALMQQRFEAGHARLIQIAAAIPTVMFAALAFVTAETSTRDVRSPLLVGSLACAALATLTCWAARFAFATFHQVDPQRLYTEYLHLSEVAFRAYAISWAGDSFERNRRTTLRVFYAALVAVILFGLSMALMTLWAVAQIG